MQKMNWIQIYLNVLLNYITEESYNSWIILYDGTISGSSQKVVVISAYKKGI
jgi:hypothetical protein